MTRPDADHDQPGERAEPACAVDTLIRQRLKELDKEGTSVAALERENGFRAGALAHPLRPERRGKWPSLNAINLWAQALQLDTTVVSRAFAEDLEGVTGAYTPEQQQILVLMERLDRNGQRAAVRLVETLADFEACKATERQPPTE